MRTRILLVAPALLQLCMLASGAAAQEATTTTTNGGIPDGLVSSISETPESTNAAEAVGGRGKTTLEGDEYPTDLASRKERKLFLDFFFGFIQGILSPPSPPPKVDPPGAINSESLPSTAGFSLRINCGGSAFTDSAGNQWLGDAYHNGKGGKESHFWNTIFGAPDAGLYQSYRSKSRWFEDGDLAYNIPVPNGKYKQVFFLAADVRRFNIWVEDSLVFSSFDVASTAGGPDKAVDLSTLVVVEDGSLDIDFEAISRDPFISAIEILGVPDEDSNVEPPPPVPSPTKAPVGVPNEPVSEAPTTASPSTAFSTTVSPTTGAPTHSPVGYPTTDWPTEPQTPPINDAWMNEPTASPPTAAPTRTPSEYPTHAPVNHPTTPWPTQSPLSPISDAPTRKLTEYPSAAVPTRKPMEYSTHSPVDHPTTPWPTQSSVTEQPTDAPVPFPTGSTLKPEPTDAPVKAPTDAPVKAPTDSPVKAPTDPPVASVDNFETIRINSGGDKFDENGITWMKDSYFSGGLTYSDARYDVTGTEDDLVFQTERYGEFTYEIPVPNANFEVVFHLSELFFSEKGQRLFNIAVEGQEVFSNVDIVQLGGGSNLKALSLETPQVVSDGFLTISFTNSAPKTDNPKVSGIEIKLVEDHLAHAVADGPYTGVDTDGDGFAVVSVDGGYSHTHATDQTLTNYIWKMGSTVLAQGGDKEETELTLPVGDHTISLTVVDSAGNDATESTTISVLSSDFPAVENLSPDEGSVSGGLEVTIVGSGFTSSAEQTKVMFGLVELTGDAITIVNEKTIKVKSPSVSIGTPVAVSVTTQKGNSNAMPFTYVASSPIEFDESGLMLRIQRASSVRFGPDRRLYVGTERGYMHKITFLEGGFKIADWVTVAVSEYRSILGIAFDPLDTADHPKVYFAHSFFFHGEWQSTSGKAINGKISFATGPNLEKVTDVITGLPVSDHDHGINGLEFGDNGELYIQIGSNTNAGIPGQLTGKQLQKETVLTAATLVAHLGEPNFDGTITYDANDDGNQVGALGFVEVYAAGLRNPFGIVLHSNGYLYGTDNGPNLGYGDRALDCNGKREADIEEEDKLLLLEKGNYYGHANLKRGEKDQRQCKWRSSLANSGDGYTAPLMVMTSSMNGIFEWRTNHFDGQLRNLIISKYNGPAYRVILSNDGRSVKAESNPALPLVGDKGLDITQAPSGEIIEARYEEGDVWYHRPKETTTSSLIVYSVFPERGGQAGGNSLHIYGRNFDKGTPTVKVGESDCPVVFSKAGNKYDRIECTLPGGSGTVDISVTIGNEVSIFPKGYRYISGVPLR